MNRYPKTILLAVILSIFISSAKISLASCLTLTSDLAYGDNDSDTRNQVTLLQGFLRSVNYLSASPNGHFGPSTLAAVKAFQKAKGISATGSVGPLTRKAIGNASCTTPSTPSPTPTPTPSATPIFIDTPSAGESLTSGTQRTISWNTSTNGIYSIVLESEDGMNGGFIAYNRSGGTSFAWRVGQIYASDGQTTTMVPPGKYRIRIQGSNGPSSSDKFSGYFKVEGQPLIINSILPRSVPHDDRSSVVLYGSGFDSTARVFFNGYAVAANILYTSPDGKVLVFTVPNYITADTYRLSLSNSYASSTDVTTLTVTN